jgi:hypothetical protein
VNPTVDLEKIASQLVADRYVTRRFKSHLLGFLSEAYGLGTNPYEPDLEIFVNAQSNTYQKEINNICGSVQLSPVRVNSHSRKTIARVPDCGFLDFSNSKILYDSGAFTDVLTNCRVTPEEALDRQLSTLERLPRVRETFLVSYDLLIDEKYVNGTRKKERWTVSEGDKAVDATVAAAEYLNSQRYRLQDFTLVQSCQGVNAEQYKSCVEEVLAYCQPGDCLGLGGWCILGKQKRWLPTFFQVIDEIIPAIAEAGIDRVHIFGVTWYKPIRGCIPPLPVLLHQCDRYGIKLTTDGRSPIGNALWSDWRKAGATFPYWRHNLAWVKAETATLRDSPFYQKVSPPKTQQLTLF